MNFLELFGLILAAASALLGGGWALLQIHFNLKEKHAAAVQDGLKEAISSLERVTEKLSSKLDEVRKELDTRITELGKQFAQMTSSLHSTEKEINRAIVDTREGFQESVTDLKLKLAAMTPQTNALEEKAIGEGRYRLTPKKPKG